MRLTLCATSLVVTTALAAAQSAAPNQIESAASLAAKYASSQCIGLGARFEEQKPISSGPNKGLYSLTIMVALQNKCNRPISYSPRLICDGKLDDLRYIWGPNWKPPVLTLGPLATVNYPEIGLSQSPIGCNPSVDVLQ